MIRAIALTVALLAAAPAFAEGGDVVLTIQNRSSLTISALNSYPIDADGEPVEDNLGALMGDILPGATAAIELDGRCGPTLLLVGIASQGDEPDTEFRINTCKSRTLVLSDPSE